LPGGSRLQHTSATLLLLDGVNVKAVSAGHTSAKMTLDVYAAFLPEMDEKTAASARRTLDGSIVPPLSHGGFIGGEGI
jgi:integrase